MTLHDPASMSSPAATSTGLAPQTAAALAYAGWWLTGLVFWFLEREDRYVRFHAAQAITAFGLIAALVGVCGLLAAVALSFLPAAFPIFLVAAGVSWVAGLVLSLVAMWKAATGVSWRIPIAAGLADRLM